MSLVIILRQIFALVLIGFHITDPKTVTGVGTVQAAGFAPTHRQSSSDEMLHTPLVWIVSHTATAVTHVFVGGCNVDSPRSV